MNNKEFSFLTSFILITWPICICFTKRIPLNSKFMTFALIVGVERSCGMCTKIHTFVYKGGYG